jgi:heme/copper-type cytochrome/quinol oxidase subunit 2
MNNFGVFHVVVLFLLGVVLGVVLMVLLAVFRHDRARKKIDDE